MTVTCTSFSAAKSPLSFQYKTQYSLRVVNRTVTSGSSLAASLPQHAGHNSSLGYPTPLSLLANATRVWHNVTHALGGLPELLSSEEQVSGPGSVNGVNALGLVVFSICFGLVIGNMKERGHPLREFFDCLNEAILRMVAVIIW